MKKLLLVLVSVFLLMGCCTNKCNSQTTDGLMVYLPFNGNADDESEYGWHDGIVYGATLVEDRFGNSNSAYYFDGINDYILVENGHTVDLGESFTISVWLFFEDLNINADVISKSHDDSWIPGNKAIKLGNNKPYFGAYGIGIPSISPILFSNRWYNIVFTYNQETGFIEHYIDLLKYEYDDPYFLPSDNGDDVMYVGRNGLGYFLDGKIDDIRIYDRVLTEDEIEELFDEVVVGVKEVETKLKLRVYPNPTNSTFTTELEGNNTIEIFNVNGQLILKEEFINSVIIDISQYNKGMYYYQIGEVKGKIIKN